MMEQVCWFSYSDSHNCFGGSSMGPDVIAFFLRRVKHRITAVMNEKESLLRDNEEPHWVDPIEDPREVKWLYESIVERHDILHIEADIWPNGKAYMSGGECYIIYPREIPVRPLVRQVLDYGGYLAADKILDFLDKRYPMSYLIDIAKGVLPNDLTDEFAMMVEWNHKLEKEEEELANVELPEDVLLDLEKNKPPTPPEDFEEGQPFPF